MSAPIASAGRWAAFRSAHIISDAEASIYPEPEHGTWVSGEALWAFLLAIPCCAPVAAIVLWWLT